MSNIRVLGYMGRGEVRAQVVPNLWLFPLGGGAENFRYICYSYKRGVLRVGNEYYLDIFEGTRAAMRDYWGSRARRFQPIKLLTHSEASYA